MQKLMTVQEVAEYLRVSTFTVLRYIDSGKMSAIALGKEYRVSSDQLSIFLETRSHVKVKMSKPESVQLPPKA